MRLTVIPLAAVTLLLLAAPLAVEAQQAGRIPRVGILRTGAPDLIIDAFRRGLGEFGWVEGRNISLEYRFAGEQLGQLPNLAADLVRVKVDVIFAPTFPAALAARNATQSIPVVAAGHADFVQAGLVTTLARPGGNVTGITTSGVELGPKRLELLRESIPGLVRLAILRHPANPVAAFAWKTTEPAAESLGLRIQLLDVRCPDDFDAAFRAATAARAEALLVLPDPMIIGNLNRIADFATKYKLPAIFEQREFVEAGGLMSYGANSPAIYRRAAYFVDKILKGAKPADLPVEQPTKFELVINATSAKALGLTIPPSLLLRADQIID
jgi:putative ABC transport system substrate-binding protein